MSFAITNYSNGGLGDVTLTCGGGITGGVSNGPNGAMITVAGFSGTDSNGFDRTLMNGTWYCNHSDANNVNLDMYIPVDNIISGAASGPTLTIGSDASRAQCPSRERIPEFVKPYSFGTKTSRLCNLLRGSQEVTLHFASWTGEYKNRVRILLVPSRQSIHQTALQRNRTRLPSLGAEVLP